MRDAAPIRRNYPLLLVSQFLSAFADNFILTLILGPFLTEYRNGRLSGLQQSLDNIYYTSLLFIPYVLFAPVAGYLNDRFSKNRGLIAGNFIKLIGAGLAARGDTANTHWLSAGYLIVGVGACVYSPAKYGILPEILPVEGLVKANGLLEMLTLVAILGGNVAGGVAFDHLRQGACYFITMALYASSLGLNLLMSRTPSYREVKFRSNVGEFFQNVHALVSDRRLARILFGTALFWICGAVLKMNFEPWGQRVLHLETMTQITLLGLWLSIGLMLGGLLAGQVYRVGDLHATRLYGWLLSAGVAVLAAVGWIHRHGGGHALFWAIPVLILTGLAAFLFLIPLNAALQAESHRDKLGKTIATQNGFENIAMLCGSVIAWIEVGVGANPSGLFLGLAIFAFVAVSLLKIPPRT